MCCKMYIPIVCTTHARHGKLHTIRYNSMVQFTLSEQAVMITQGCRASLHHRNHQGFLHSSGATRVACAAFSHTKGYHMGLTPRSLKPRVKVLQACQCLSPTYSDTALRFCTAACLCTCAQQDLPKQDKRKHQARRKKSPSSGQKVPRHKSSAQGSIVLYY
jgi:hypothetical protein